MYSCGPTVYWYQHIGNLRAYIFADVLKRVLMYNGLKVKHVVNITDVGHIVKNADLGDDKMEMAAKKEGKSAKKIADYYFKIFHEDLGKLNVIEPKVWSKATEHIKEQIDLIKRLEKKKFTYKTKDGIYYDSNKFKNYAKLAKLNLEGLQEGKRIAMGGKKNKTDFALWKFSENPGERQQEWDSPFGIGFPGWHIECSAMSMKYLGERFDIHTGGEDHIPVHHTNEIAQSEGATGKRFVNYWMHNAFLTSNGKKVSKSKGGLYTLSELEKQGYKAEHYRYFNFLTVYRKNLEFSLDNLDNAKNAFEKLRRKVIELKSQRHKGKDDTKKYDKMFLDAVNDDLNMPKAIQVVWKMLDDFDFEPKKKVKLLEKFDKILGLGIKDMKEEVFKILKEVKELVKRREEAREKKMWVEADILRDRIKERGFVIEDSSEGVKLSKI